MMFPADIVNRALDAIGSPATLGDPDLQDGTPEAAAALRIYGPTLRQMLRAALWGFARKQQPMTLLQDATGQTPNVGTGTPGMGPWLYEYAWPIDAVRARFVPQRVPPPNPPNMPPIMTGLAVAAPLRANIPARFVVTQDNIPSAIGAITDWSQLPSLDGVMGYSLSSQTVVLTNVQNATLVYTALITYPDQWDQLFQQAMVAALAERLAMPCLPDKKFALQVRGQMIGSAKSALDAARRVDGDEGWNQNDHTPDWIRARDTGATWNAWGLNAGGGQGVLGYGWESYAFSDGAAY